jgi:hypothetical protein
MRFPCGLRKHKGHSRLRQRARAAKLTPMLLQKYLLIAACVLLLACGSESRRPKPPKISAAFPSLPLPPNGQFVSRSASEDALQITFFSPIKAPLVTEYYRKLLNKEPWKLVSDVQNDSSRVLYAVNGGRPMWVRLWGTSDERGTMVELSGAAVQQAVKPTEPGTSPKKH